MIGRHYDKIVQHLIHQLKYGKGTKMAPWIGTKLARIIHTTELIDLMSVYQ